MFFAQRTVQRARTICFAVAGYVAFVAIVAGVAVLFRSPAPSYGQAFLALLVGLPVVLLIWCMLEISGTKFLSMPFWQKISSTARISLLVLVIVTFVVGVIVILRLI